MWGTKKRPWKSIKTSSGLISKFPKAQHWNEFKYPWRDSKICGLRVMLTEICSLSLKFRSFLRGISSILTWVS